LLHFFLFFYIPLSENFDKGSKGGRYENVK
jgi:hypothetical protein